MKAKPIGFMVFWNDEGGLCVPYGADADCEGAIESNDAAPLLFANRRLARRAITISQRNAKLREAQGLIFNEDFANKKAVQIVPVYAAV